MTPYPDVTEALDLVHSELTAVLGKNFVGLYLWGSLAAGDFDPCTSDIDLVAVPAEELVATTVPSLEAAYARITGTGLYWANRLEIDFIPERSFRRYDPADEERPRMDFEDGLVLQRQDSGGIIQRHLLRESGVTLAGPKPKSLIDPVSPDSLREAVRALLADKWSGRVRNRALLENQDYQAYAILTMCRMLYTLQHGSIVSKPVAARWALKSLDPPWRSLVQRALAWPRETGPAYLDEVRALIRFSFTQADAR